MAATLPGRMSAYSELILRVVGIIDVGCELLRGPVVEEAGEDEAAIPAAAVVDLDAGETEGERVAGRAVFIEVEAVERRESPPQSLHGRPWRGTVAGLIPRVRVIMSR